MIGKSRDESERPPAATIQTHMAKSRKDPQELYGSFYFEHYLTEEGRIRYERKESWQRLFAMVADRIITDLEPRSVLDAGCAMGLLVESLRDRGVEAYGIDISEYAIERVREDVRPFCRVASVTQDLDRDYDLIVCVEVLEHLEPADAELAVDNFCRHSRQVLFSSSPLEFREETHYNVRPPEYWARVFARHGFYRDLDHDATTYVTPHAARFRKVPDATMTDVVADYERAYWRAKLEADELRRAAGDRVRELADAIGQRDLAVAETRQLRERLDVIERWLAWARPARKLLSALRSRRPA